MQNKKINLALIAARKNSRGVKNKNLIRLKGNQSLKLQ